MDPDLLMVARLPSYSPLSFAYDSVKVTTGLIISDGGTIRHISSSGLQLLRAGPNDVLVGRALSDFGDTDWAATGRLPASPMRHHWTALDGQRLELEITITRLGELGNYLIIEFTDVGLESDWDNLLTLARAQLNRRSLAAAKAAIDKVGDRLPLAEGVVGVDQRGRITFVNDGVTLLTGWPGATLIGSDFETSLLRQRSVVDRDPTAHPAPPHPPMFATLCHDLIERRHGGALELLLWRVDGSSLPVELAVLPVGDGAQEKPSGLMVLFRDLSIEKHTEERLRLASAVFDNASEGIAVLDANFRVTMVNPAFRRMTGFETDEVYGRLPFFMNDMAEDGALVDQIWNAVRVTGRWENEVWSARSDGTDYAVRLSISATIDEIGNFNQYVVVFSDITQRKRDEERIRYQANYDALTGLPNRSLFMDRLTVGLHQAGRNGHRLGLMFIDLDGFKLINDTLGHDIGDELLKEVAQRLLVCVRQGDTVTRFGGDEFTIIMPDLGDLRNVLVIAHRIIDSLKLPFLLKGNEATISASIGITSFPDDAQTVQALLKHADAAMYRAKETGKANFQFYTAGLDTESSARLTIKNGLSRALEREEFELLYQPKSDVATGRLTGAEGLLRWHSAEMGMMLPATFIPILEETGLIDRVGDWVLETACRQHKLWRDAGHGHMRVAVNLSVRQLRHGTLVKTVETLLSRYSIDPSGLELEITESMIMKDTENAVTVLKDLSAMGVHLTMDDFGTGYSSLSYLKRFPQNTIKIDRSFVNDIAVDPDDLEIIRTIINMGHSLRRKVVAEGVETEAQRLLLRHLRCDEMQGYLLSPPVAASEIDKMLASTRHGGEV